MSIIHQEFRMGWARRDISTQAPVDKIRPVNVEGNVHLINTPVVEHPACCC